MAKRTCVFSASSVAALCMAVNILLAAGKLIISVVGRSSALLSDAADSAADVFAALLVLAALKISAKEADSDHPYGHERFESISSLLLALLMAFSALRIGWGSVEKLLAHTQEPPALLTLSAALLSAAAKLLLARFSRTAAARFSAPALADTAKNYRTDAIGSLLTAAGIWGSISLAPWLDPAAGCVICLGVLRSAWDIFAGATDALVDRACDSETQQHIRDTVLSVPGVHSIEKLLTRRFGSRIYVEIEISADGNLPLSAAHDIAEQAHDAVERALPQIKHCTVHVEPAAL